MEDHGSDKNETEYVIERIVTRRRDLANTLQSSEAVTRKETDVTAYEWEGCLTRRKTSHRSCEEKVKGVDALKDC